MLPMFQQKAHANFQKQEEKFQSVMLMLNHKLVCPVSPLLCRSVLFHYTQRTIVTKKKKDKL